MTSNAPSVAEYVSQVATEKKELFDAIRKVIKKNLPKGFEECMNYGMIGYVVPHKMYPAGYHCDPKLPLPFLGLAAQKNSVNFYHMGVYAQPDLLKWFTEAHAKANPKKLDMGKSCVRYKSMEHVPLDVIGDLVKKMTPQDWISIYEKAFIKK
jgi:uncharacterized protein YdhG (YjbR/CyaY superfamily)